MIVDLAMVMSADGKTTRWSEAGTRLWSSPEDLEQCTTLRDHHDAVILGRATYEGHRDQITPSATLLRIIMTRHPERYADETITGKIEFSNKRPTEILDELEERGCKTVLLATGAALNAGFLQTGRVNTIYQTIEPVLFGTGNAWANDNLHIGLKLQSITQLNTGGTLLLQYDVSGLLDIGTTAP